MSVFTRIMLVYMIGVMLVAVFGLAAYQYIVHKMEDDLYANLTATSTRMSQQFDSLVRPMEYTSLHLLSNRHFLNAMEDLAGIDRDKMENRAQLSLASNEIYSQMMSYSLNKYFHRVSVFNTKKDFFTSHYNYRTDFPSGGYDAVIDNLDDLDLLRQYDGRTVIIPPFQDPWDLINPQMVFAVSRAIRSGHDMGFIEIQQLYSELTGIFDVGGATGAFVCAVTREGSVLYNADVTGKQLEYYRSIATDPYIYADNSFTPRLNPVTGKSEVFTATHSDYTGVTVLLIQDQVLLLEPLTILGQQMLILYLVVVAFSCSFLLLQGRSIVAPLRQLKHEMDKTRLENLPDSGSISSSNNEIISLNHAFNDLKERLNELIYQELNLHTLHMKASFDALQAQVNPHFIYNTLGLISNRAAMQDDDEICNICSSIASMLRYSVNTKARLVTLQEELKHLDSYIFLMKARYEHRIEFSSEVDESILCVTLPKMVLQPLVENTIDHGFANMEDTMRIHIIGTMIDERWRVEISDNGQGFSEQTLVEIYDKFQHIKTDPRFIQENGGELGGLGIVNIYARLMLISSGRVTMELHNHPMGGAQVVLSGPLDSTPNA